MSKAYSPARAARRGANSSREEPTSSPETSASTSAATARVASRCWGRRPGFGRWARARTRVKGLPVMAESARAVRRICPPPSPALPSRTIGRGSGTQRIYWLPAAPLRSKAPAERASPRPSGGVLEVPVVAAALAIFALTYLAVAAGRLPFLSVDRPAAALLGAVLMVAAGVLAPSEAGAAVNGDTLGLLLGMMILSAYLGEAGFFRWASWRVLRTVSGPRTLLWALVFTAGVLSAFLVNDTVCLMVTPIVLRILDDAELPPLPYLLAVAFGSNAGSAATLTGNPQNMIVGTLSGLSCARFAGALALPALAALVVVAVVLHALFRRDLARAGRLHRRTEPPPVERRLLAKALAALGVALAGFVLGFPLSWTALFAGALLMAVAGRAPREALARVDWPLLVFFAGLFVVVAGVARSGASDRMHDAIAPLARRGRPAPGDRVLPVLGRGLAARLERAVRPPRGRVDPAARRPRPALARHGARGDARGQPHHHRVGRERHRARARRVAGGASASGASSASARS